MSEHEAEINVSEGLSADDFIVEDDRIIIKSKSFARLVKGLKERVEEHARERAADSHGARPTPPPPPIIHVNVGL